MQHRPRGYGILIAALLGALTSGCSIVESLGRNIPQGDLVGDYFRALLWALALSLTIVLAPVPKGDKPRLLKFWGIKVAVALGAMLLYEYRYGLDAYYYFTVAQGPFEWQGLRFGAGTHNMFHFAWLHDHVVPDSYHAIKVTCALLGMWAVYLFYRSAVLHLGREEPRLFWALALYPSILFWSSILGKDPIVLLGIGLYVFGVMLWAKQGRWLGILIAVGGLCVAVLIRTWLGPILLAPLAVFVFFRAKSVALKVVLVTVAVGGFLFAVEGLLERFNVETSEDLFLTTNRISRSWSHGGSGQQVRTEFTSLGSIVSFLPQGVTAALFRPLPFEILNPFGLIAGFENAALLFLLWQAIKRSRRADLRDPVILWVILTITTWAVVYGFVSYQNLGSAVRFRLQVLPLLVCVLLYLSRRRPAGSAVGRPVRPPRNGVRPLKLRPGRAQPALDGATAKPAGHNP